MKKYAEIYGGLVRDLRESHLGYTEFCSIFDPASYWLDVTGVDDIGVDYVVKFSPERGTYFEKPEPLVDTQTVEFQRSRKLELLDREFSRLLGGAYCMSSLGFMINAGERAKSDIDGLITRMEAESAERENFMDLNNVLQPVTLEELKILRLEVIKNGQSLYAQKWDMRDRINNALTPEELEAVDIQFHMYDFMLDDWMEA